MDIEVLKNLLKQKDYSGFNQTLKDQDFGSITKWLREKHLINIYLTADWNTNELLGYFGIIQLILSGTPEEPFQDILGASGNDYNEVLEKTIIKALSYVKDKV